MFLSWLGTVLFPWKRRVRGGSGILARLGKLLPKSPVPPIPEKPAVKTVEQKSAELNVAQ